MTAEDHGARRYLDQVSRANTAVLIDAWVDAGEPDRAREVAELAVRQGLWEQPMQRPRDHVAGLAARPVHDAGDFWFSHPLQERGPALRAEIDHAIASGALGSARAGTWRRTFLFSDGGWHEDVCALLPVTRGVLAEIPEATTFSAGAISVARLAPGTHTRPTCGRTNAVLTVQLGITVPEGAGLRIGDEHLAWQPERCAVIDGSFEHSAFNDGDHDLVLLDIEVPHPDLPGSRDRPRPDPTAPIASFLRDRGMSAVEVRDGRVELTPDTATQQVLAKYMSASQVVGAERDGDVVRWLHDDAAGD
ncbi:aspartyl/asparaginyl beta-hydroxylase domain-containing protein [Actinokineospora guangxiensis]|uniref:Aspartyl/asparaginyl beta-hydroxylase domain-containing protein n=1 Tax=Actinokineospora guangxiensis TaxID=1490288 RepID=A0ABW0ER15_9PSEU